MRRIFLFAPVMYRSIDQNIRLERLAEQAVFAVFVSLALTPFVDVAPLSYAGFLLLGLAPWYFFRELLTDLPAQAAAFSSGALKEALGPFRVPLCNALAALPTLLLWSAIAFAVCGLTGASLKNPPLLLFALFCNLYNAAMQGLLLCAFTPLLKGGNLAAGLSVTLPFLFWSTPLAWPYTPSGTIVQLMMQANPLYYIAECYRLSFTGGLPQTRHTLIFFLATLLYGAAGFAIAKRIWRLPSAHGGALSKQKIGGRS